MMISGAEEILVISVYLGYTSYTKEANANMSSVFNSKIYAREMILNW